MAIFIIDQFSLNTDLPLDIRYVPSGGHLSPDISAYKYPGMQAYDTLTETIWYADNSLNWVEVGSGSDASINEIWNVLNIIDSSIGDIYNQLTTIDGSIGDIYNILTIHDASIGNLEVRVSTLEDTVIQLDASIVDINNYQVIQDASITTAIDGLAQLDASIVDINAYQVIQDASITTAIDGLAQLDASIVNINTELNQVDASITAINNYQAIQDASILAAGDGIAQLDASIVIINNYQTIQDGSISANAGDIIQIEASIGDINNYQTIQDASISALEASLGDYVKKTGDTMTGDLIVNAGLSVLQDTSLSNFNASGDGVISGDLAIGGNLQVDGSVTYINTEQVDVSDNFINLNSGLTGTPPATLQSGIAIGRGDEEPYVFLFDEDTATFRIGIAAETSTGYLDSSTQAVATREDNPLSQGIAYWNSTESRFDTSVGFQFDPTDGQLTLDGSLVLLKYAAVGEALVIGPGGVIESAPIPSVANFTTFTYVDGSLAARDVSINYLAGQVVQLDASITDINTELNQIDASLIAINNYQAIQDASITANTGDIVQLDASITNINNYQTIQDGSISANAQDITAIDLSINELYTLDASNIKGAINVGDGSAQVFRDVSNGLLTFREIAGVGAATVTQSGDVIEIGIDASFGGEVNTASNVGSGTGIFDQKVAQDLQFKSLSTLDPSTVIITSDATQVYIDVSIAPGISDASISGLTDTSINDAALVTHQILEYNLDGSVWENTNGILWDTSVGTTADGFNSIPQGTDLNGLTLKEILFKILYEYQAPNLTASGTPSGGIFEKGSLATQFASIDIDWSANNNNYPLALLNNVNITKTGSGSIFDASLGLVASDSSTYTDGTGITNWGGVNRTITYQVEISDDQGDQSQPAVIDQVNYTFYYPMRWGIVPKNTAPGAVNSSLILGLDSSTLQGKTDLTATFDNPAEDQIHHLFAYVDTIAAPDNFGQLADIIDQNGYNVTGSFTTGTTDVSTDGGNVRYRFYLLNNWVDTSTFDYTFKF